MNPEQFLTLVPYLVLFPNREEWTKNKTFPLSSNLTFYTDGSVMNGHSGVGIGIFSSHPESKVSISLGQYAPVFQAETYAISVCVKHGLDENYHRLSKSSGGNNYWSFYMQEASITKGLKQSLICHRCHSDEETMYHLVCLCLCLCK
jgi:hypothetical protein